jgi:hypothetical protein
VDFALRPLLGVTLGFNEYKCFYENKKPDWDTIFEGKENEIFSVIILDNNSGIILQIFLRFSYSDLAKDFEKPI